MKLPFYRSKILLPKDNIDLNKWSVVACDQHTSNIGYWTELKEYVGASDSTLNLILPEVYLNSDTSDLVKNISGSMNDYLKRDVFYEAEGVIFVERTLNNKKVRKGLVVAVDLEDYSFVHTDFAFIRASEGTVLERIPPRVKIREKCALELPHIMLLADDPQNLLFNAVQNCPKTPVYDFELNMNGGHLKGSLIKDITPLEKELEKLYNESKKKLTKPMLFAVGDGNHSLATAKRVYENEKNAGADTSLSRYALVEIVNIYDSALEFEPIHRVIFNADNKKLLEEFKKAEQETYENYVFFDKDKKAIVKLPANPIEAVKVCESVISSFVKNNGGVVDYIHGEREVEKLCITENAAGILLKSMKKSDLFPYVAEFGALPKKTFSMGEAEDKRYYLEARRIK